MWRAMGAVSMNAEVGLIPPYVPMRHNHAGSVEVQVYSEPNTTGTGLARAFTAEEKHTPVTHPSLVTRSVEYALDYSDVPCNRCA